jgi:hypothetical protein
MFHKHTHMMSPRHAHRRYSGLGPDLWLVKLRAPLPQLLGTAGCMTSSRVKPACVAGLEALGALKVCVWGGGCARLVGHV